MNCRLPLASTRFQPQPLQNACVRNSESRYHCCGGTSEACCAVLHQILHKPLPELQLFVGFHLLAPVVQTGKPQGYSSLEHGLHNSGCLDNVNCVCNNTTGPPELQYEAHGMRMLTGILQNTQNRCINMTDVLFCDI